ncbi:cobalamin-binding protein [Noviherbaspirillum denitrificans]|uniref:Cobalamin-binding protein n=1 Tax=Noviherbaspirillum denitrificans TaxID=1968433 RepID=A0A254TH17_9BURK|nr:cobalamin-binding protein [Noviherbaspirillum denitrificans]OWW19833.1 cobalamin-binding protein [Noviherbaspirillum denitrificans]
MPHFRIRPLLLTCVLALGLPAQAAVTVIDDARRSVTLPAPARRIVSLAPHATEMLFAAGAGAYIVGVTEFSDYPPEAKRIQSVGSGVSLDLERIIQLKPDLIVGWNNGMAAGQLAKLETLGIPIYKSEPYDFPAIAHSLERLARLAGTDATGQAAAMAFRQRWKKLQDTYQRRRSVTVFYQIWRSPLMTLNGSHLVSSALRLCGGENIFARLPQLAPTVSEEAVIKADPEAIVASSGEQDDVFAPWRRFPGLKAVAGGNLISIDGNLMNRAGPRILDGTEDLCRKLDAVRAKRPTR